MQNFDMLIDGRLVGGAFSFDVLNPATEQVLARAPAASPEQLDEAANAAASAFPAWSKTPIATRRATILSMADRLDEHRDELARLLTQEQGKPLEEARGEIAFSAFIARQHAKYDLAVEVRQDLPEQRTEIHRIPLGVVGAIVAWDFPIMLFPDVPFGGARLSGFGSELAREGLEAFAQLKVVSMRR